MPSKVQRMEKSNVSSYVNNKGRNEAVLLFGLADFCFMYLVNNHRRFSNPIKPQNIKGIM